MHQIDEIISIQHALNDDELNFSPSTPVLRSVLPEKGRKEEKLS